MSGGRRGVSVAPLACSLIRLCDVNRVNSFSPNTRSDCGHGQYRSFLTPGAKKKYAIMRDELIQNMAISPYNDIFMTIRLGRS
jgi:hypothetical protein